MSSIESAGGNPPGTSENTTEKQPKPPTNGDTGTENQYSTRLIPWVLWPTLIIIVLFVGVTIAFPEAMESGISAVQQTVISNFSWWYLILAFGFVVFCVYLGFSRKGNIKLGRPEHEPEFSTLSWLSLLFAAGMGIGLVFYGMTEPLIHFATPRPGLEATDPSTGAMAEDALALTYLHWGLQPWAIYAVVGLAIAHAIHRRGRPLSMRWAVEPLIGEKATRGGWGHAIDSFALIGTVFGVATSLGLGVTQMAAGLRSMGVVGEGDLWVEYAMIAVVTGFVIWSVVSGVNRGMKWLSNTNMIIAAGLVLFLLIVGPTQYLAKEMVQTFGHYLQNFIGNSLNSSAFYGAEGDAWQASWSTFYWAWWMSWTPFVGVFIARISRGRTVREYLLGVILVPTLISVLWFGVLGGTAIYYENTRPDWYTSVVGPDGAVDVNSALFQVLEQLPGGAVLVVGAILLSAIFFITSSDSGSLVMAMIATGGNPEPPNRIRVMFAVATAVMAAALLLAGGLSAIQTLAITIGLPFTILMVLMCIAVFKALHVNVQRTEAIRRMAFLADISDRFGLESDDDAVDSGPVSANTWWSSLSRERQREIHQRVGPHTGRRVRQATGTAGHPGQDGTSQPDNTPQTDNTSDSNRA
ncbi:BCCT family transporter [Citricoccus parietis]|uniref:BCCT family transporter n=1 Tax=Citricoccus parietis TaxID=592307 RepID=A0ABV6F3E6_9MICC